MDGRLHVCTDASTHAKGSMGFLLHGQVVEVADEHAEEREDRLRNGVVLDQVHRERCIVRGNEAEENDQEHQQEQNLNIQSSVA